MPVTLSPEQFSALSDLLRLRAGPAREAARLVMVDGRTVTEAASQTGISQPAVSNAVARVRRGYQLARQAAGMDST